jgi:hypothetical protein
LYVFFPMRFQFLFTTLSLHTVFFTSSHHDDSKTNYLTIGMTMGSCSGGSVGSRWPGSTFRQKLEVSRESAVLWTPII